MIRHAERQANLKSKTLQPQRLFHEKSHSQATTDADAKSQSIASNHFSIGRLKDSRIRPLRKQLRCRNEIPNPVR